MPIHDYAIHLESYGGGWYNKGGICVDDDHTGRVRKYRTMLAAHKRVNFSRLPPAKISITRQVTFDFCSSQSVSKKPDGMGLQGASEIPTDTAIMVEIGVA